MSIFNRSASRCLSFAGSLLQSLLRGRSKRFHQLPRKRAVGATRIEALEERTLLSGLVSGINLNASHLAGNQTSSAIIVNPSNPQQLFVTANNASGGLFASRSNDGGATWLPSNGADFVLADGNDSLATASGDPTLAWDSLGNLFLAYTSSGSGAVSLAISTDSGATFSPLASLGSSTDQTTIAVGPGQSGVGQALWVTYNSAGMVAQGASITGVGTVSAFSSPVSLTGVGVFGDIAIGSDGQVTVVGQSDTAIQITTDPDGLGPAPFGAAVTATTTNVSRNDAIPAQPTRTVDAEAGLVYDRSTGRFHGRLYLIYTDETIDESNNLEVLVRTSIDNGATWGAPVRVNDDSTTRSQFLPKLAIDQTTGTVGAVWYDARNSATNTQVQLIGSASDTGGTTWARNTLLSQGVTDGTVASTGAQQLGGYLGLTFSNGVMHPSWADNSNRTFNNPNGALAQLDLYTTSVPVGTWISQGPAPGIGGQENLPPDDQINGAVQTILTDPSNPDIMYIGSVNGGVWKTTNATAAAPHWVPLTDNLPSLSIGALDLDPTDPTHQTIIAGVGATSSFFLGEEFRGLLRSTDGGVTWTEIGVATFSGQNIWSVTGRGSVLMAGTDNVWGGGGSGGLYRSTNGGANWVLVSGSAGLPLGNVSDIVGDPVNPNTFYAAVRGNGGGVFRSTDAGASWTNITTGIGIVTSSTTKIELAVHNNAGTTAVFAVVANSSSVAGVFRSLNGAAFTSLDVPNGGGQAFVHMSVAAHPTNPNLVYVGGAAGTVYLARINASAASGSQITNIGTGAFNAPHVDTRELVFDANGNLVLGTDGGLFRMTTPAGSGSWSSIMGDLSVFEAHDVDYDSISNVLMIGTQDNGTLSQNVANGTTWVHPGFGDGGDVIIDDVSLAGINRSIRYLSSQNLGGWTRQVYDSNSNLLSSTGLASIGDAQFVTPVALNVINPLRILVGGSSSVYESSNQGSTLATVTGGTGVNGSLGGPMVYGGYLNGVANEDLIYVGVGSQVRRRTTAGGTLTATSALPSGASTIRDIIVDSDNYQRVFAIDDNQVFMSTNGGTNWTDITAGLTGISQPVFNSLAFVAGASEDAVVVGTNSGVFASRISTIGTWYEVGTNLPNVISFDLEYDRTDDVLVVGTMGRGAWSLPEARYNVIGAAGVVGAVVTESGGTTRIAEGGTQDSYTIALNTVPTGTVQITVTADGQTQVSTDGVNFFSSRVLSFTDTTPRNVFVRAIDDLAAEGSHFGTINQIITSSADVNYVVGTVLSSVTAAIDDNELSLFQRLQPLGSLISSSTNNSGSLADSTDHRDYTFFAEGGETIAAIATPTTGVTLTVQLLGIPGSANAGTPATMGPQSILADGQYTIRVTGAAAAVFDLKVYKNVTLESLRGNSSDGNELPIDDSVIQVGAKRFAALGTAAPINIPRNFVQYNNPALFVDISTTGAALNLADDDNATIVTTVGNAAFPAGNVTVGNNGGIIAGSSQNVGLPNTGLPSPGFANALLPFWADVDADTGNVYWREMLVGGVNTLIVQWENRPHFSNTGSATFQLQLFASGPILARFVYEDVNFGNPSYDFGADATIGYQENGTSATQFSFNTAAVANGDVLDLMPQVFLPDVDEYTIDLTGKVGKPIDVVLTGVNATDFSGQVLELLNPSGTVVATGVIDPVQTGVNATNQDLSIFDFVVPSNGIYTIRVSSVIAGDYTLVVTDSMSFEAESNNLPATDPLRNLTVTQEALGYVSVSDVPSPLDTYRVVLTAGQSFSVTTSTPFDSASNSPSNSLNPELRVIHPDGSTVVASDLNSAPDGKNAQLTFTAPVAGTYQIRVLATSGSGEYYLHAGTALTPPVIVSLSPPDDSTTFPLTTDLVMTFNEPVKAGLGDILIVRSSDNFVVQTIDVRSAAVVIAGNVVTINPADLVGSTAYHILIAPTAFEDLTDTPYAGITDSTTWNFTTNDTATVSIAKITDGAEGTAPIKGRFRVTTTATNLIDSVITYSVAGTAVGGAGQDYTTLTGIVTIPAGQTTADIDVSVLNDLIVEPTETVVITLTGFVSHDPDVTLDPILANRTATMSIADDDVATVTVVRISDGAETNTPVNGLFQVVQTLVSTTDSVVSYTVAGTATPGLGNDYTTLTGTVTIPAGQTTANINVSVLNDTIVEGTETVNVTLVGVTGDPQISVASPSSGFQAAFAPATWTFVAGPSGSVSTALAPASIALTSGNSGAAGNTDYTHAIAVTGNITFNWSYTTPDGAQFDFPQYLVNGVATLLPGFNTSGPNSQSGTAVVPVTAGTTFGFRMVTTSGTLGAATTTFSNFVGLIVPTATLDITDNDTAVVTVARVLDGAETAAPVNGRFRVSQSALSTTDTVVNYSLGAGTATSGVDFTPLSGTVTIPAGQFFANIDVAVLTDNLVELTETVTVNLTALGAHDPEIALDSVSANLTATLDITDNDTATVSIALVSDGIDAAVPTNGRLRVTQTAVSATDTVITYAVSGTATPGVGNDYTTLTGTVTIPAGSTTANIDVLVLHDFIVETSEAVVVTLNGFGTHDADITLNSLAANRIGTVTITDQDSSTVSVSNANDGIEANVSTNGTFRVTQSLISSTDTVVTYTVSGTATPGVGKDYTPLSGTVTIPAGQAFADITVGVLNDTDIEPTETVLVTLTSVVAKPQVTIPTVVTGFQGLYAPASWTLVPGPSGSVNVASAPSSISLTSGNAGSAGNTDFAHYVSSSGNFTFSWSYTTSDSAARDIPQYVINGVAANLPGYNPAGANSQSGVAVIPLAANSTFAFRMLTVDGNGGAATTVFSNLSAPALQTATVNILDSDTGEVSVTKLFDGVEQNVPTDGRFRISMSGASTIDTVVNYSIGGTATPDDGFDYTILSGTVTIPAGQTFVDVDVAVLNDIIVEATETVVITLTSLGLHATGITLDANPANRTTTVSITDDDFATVSIETIADGAEAIVPANGVFRVTQDFVSSTDTVINYTISGTATPGAASDYSALAGTVTIPAGTLSVDINVSVLNDLVAEPSETVIVNLVGFGAHDANITLTPVLETRAATVVIADNDTASVSIVLVNDGAEALSPLNGRFQVVQSNASDLDTVVNYTISGTATPGAGNDYSLLSGTVTIPAGQTTANIDIAVLDDLIVEGTETVVVALTGLVNQLPGITLSSVSAELTATANILDNDFTTVSVMQVSAGHEGTSPVNGVFRVVQSAPSTTDTVVNYAITGTAGSGNDYLALTGSVTIRAGQTSADIIVNVLDDNFVEDTETVVVTLTTLGAHNAAVSLDSIAANRTASVGIVDDDVATLTISDVTNSESAGSLDFTITLDQVLDIDVTLNVTLISGTAAGGADFNATTLQVTFLAGQTSQAVQVAVTDDNLVEESETFTARLGIASAVGARLLDVTDTATGTILDNDAAVFGVESVSGPENVGSMTFAVSLDKALDIDILVDVTFVNGTAFGGSDFTGTSQSILFVAGQTTALVSVPIIDDTIVEGSESFVANLSSNTNVGSRSVDFTNTGIVTITDNDTATISISRLNNGAETNTPVAGQFAVTLSAPSSTPTVVNYSVGGTATPGAGNDYATLSGTVTIPAGQTVANITVPVLNDSFVEPTETVSVTLTAVGSGDPQITLNALLANRSATLDITDDDLTILAINSPTVTEANGVTVMTFIVTSPIAVPGGFVVDFQVTDLTATLGADYTILTSSPLTFAGNVNETQTISVSVTNDSLVEAAETLTVTLGTVTTGNPLAISKVISGAVGTGTIISDDAATFALNDVSSSESAGSLIFDLTTDHPLSVDVTVTLTFTSGSATGGGIDFASSTQTIVFQAGQTSHQLTVALNNDGLVEADETFTVTMGTNSNVTGLAVDLSDTAVGTIIDDDTATISIAKITDGVEAATPVNGRFRITQSAVSSTDTIVNYIVAGLATPGAGNDYLPLSGVVTIPAGQTTVDLNVTVLDDAIVEGTETVTINVTGLAASDPQVTVTANPALQTATVNIADSDISTLTLSSISGGSVVTEGDAGTRTITYTVTSSNAVQGGFLLDFNVVDLTTDASDYTLLTQSPLAFSGTAGESHTITIQIVGDTIVEGDEQFEVQLGAATPSGPVLASSIVTGARLGGTIVNDDSNTLSISSPTITEGNSGTTLMTFNVTSPNAVQGGFAVDFNVTNITTNSSDYVVITASPLVFSGTAAEVQTITLSIASDLVAEVNEQLRVTLGTVTPVNSVPATGITSGAAGTGTIVNDDTAVFTINNVSVSEGAGALVFDLVTDHPLDIDVVIQVNFNDLTATGAGSDYFSTPQLVNFLAGETAKTVIVSIVNDQVVEGTETFQATLSATSPLAGRSLNTSDTGTGTITDNDTATFTITDAAALEGSATLGFNLVTDKPLDTSVVITVTFTSVNATGGGTDYISTTLQLPFPAGVTSSPISIAISDDLIVEADETFTVSLSVGSPIGTRSVNVSDTGTGTILDDDNGVVSISKISDVNEGQAPTVGKFRVTQTRVSSTDTVVTYAVAGTATPGTGGDYGILSGTVTIPAGQTSADIDVAVLADALVESHETIIVTLTGLGAHDPQVTLDPLPTRLTETMSILDDDQLSLTNVSSISIPENTPIAVVLVDADSNPAAVPGHALTFSLSGPDAALFQIDSVTGQVTFRAVPNFETPLDQGTDNTYRVTVTVSTDVVPARSTSQDIVITVLGLNDNPPVFEDASPTFTIPENLAVGATVGNVPATDNDRPVQSLTYSIVSGNTDGVFAIDSSTGRISVAISTLLDFESVQSFSFTVRVTDNGNPASVAEAAVVVNLANVFEGPTITIPTESGTFEPGTTKVAVAPGAQFTYGDVANPTFAGATLVASIKSGRMSRDVLGIFKSGDAVGQITTKRRDVFADGQLIGTFTGGKGRHPNLVVTLNENVTVARLEALMNRIGFSSRSDVLTKRVIQLQLINVGGVNSNQATRELSVS